MFKILFLLQILDRLIKVDHVLNYKPPKDTDEIDDLTKFLREEGCAAKIMDENKEKIKELIERKDDDKFRVKKELDRPRYVNNDQNSGNQQYSRRDHYDRGHRSDDKEKSM